MMGRQWQAQPCPAQRGKGTWPERPAATLTARPSWESGVNPGYQGAGPTRVSQHQHLTSGSKKTPIEANAAAQRAESSYNFFSFSGKPVEDMRRVSPRAGTLSDNLEVIRPGREGAALHKQWGTEVGYPAQ
jgi:hypothetical protein